MHRVVSYVFGWIFAIVLTLALWAAYINLQPGMYSAFDSALSEEWNTDTGNNGTIESSMKDNVWDDAKAEASTGAYEYTYEISNT